MPRLLGSLFLALLLTIPVDGAKRRAVRKPVNPTTPASWLALNAHVIESTELVPFTHDLEPLGRMIGHAKIVGLGDVTHGTHELFTSKLRMIDYLVREKTFDVIALEAPMPAAERINRYVQTGEGSPRAILQDLHERLLYFFWDTEELLAVIEWVRAYNLQRGDKPMVELTGFDKFDQETAAERVVAYLQQVDPAEAARTSADYACVPGARRADLMCGNAARDVRERLAGQRETYSAASGVRAYDDALQFATIVTQFFGPPGGAARDVDMATNALWLLEHRSVTGKVILWGHQEHISRTESYVIGGPAMGAHLAAAHGDDYFTIGSMSGNATYRYWQQNTATGRWSSVIATFPQPEPGSYEAYFRTRGVQALLIPLRGSVPSWLAEPASYHSAGTIGPLNPPIQALPARLDAVLYVETSKPTTPLR